MRPVPAILIFAIVLSSSEAALAKSAGVGEKAKAGIHAKMPVVAADLGAGYEETKKMLEDLDKKPPLKEVLPQLVTDVRKAFTGLVKKAEPQRGDPKTDYAQRENALHRRPKGPETPIKLPTKNIDTEGSDSSTTYSDGVLTTVTYYFDESPSNPYDTVQVIYDSETQTLASAFGYKTIEMSTLPDLTDMTLVKTFVRADGSLAIEDYESAPTATGAVTQVRVHYETNGSVSYSVMKIIQPLDLATLDLV